MRSIGRYDILGLLGRGGMGGVYKAALPAVGRVVALKLLKPHPFLVSLLGMEELRRRFLAEARIMARLRHRNLLEVWDVDEDAAGNPYFIMEYHGHSLGSLIGESNFVEEPSRPLRLDQAADYALQILRGLERLHQAGVVHRDIKPYNIMITAENVAKIGDFGLSKLRGAAPPIKPGGLKVGTPYYAPPEQEADPEAVDHRADLYPLGAILYRLLTGRLPNLEGDYAPAAPLHAELDDDWDDFLRQALQPDPDRRTPSAATMRRQLETLLAAWRARLEATCALPPDEPASAPAAGPLASPRRAPLKVGPGEAKARFGLDDLWRPAHAPARRPLVPEGEQTARDPATGLVWQRGGSAWPMAWPEAHEHVSGLNARGFAGRADWRLPTAEELASILTAPPAGRDWCLEPVFEAEQRWLWSADRASWTSAWHADARLGFIGRQDFASLCHVRAVRG